MMKPLSYLTLSLLLTACLGSGTGNKTQTAIKIKCETNSTTVMMANLLHQKLTGGVPLLATSALYQRLIDKVSCSDLDGAAEILLNEEPMVYTNLVGPLAKTFNVDNLPTDKWNATWAMFAGIVLQNKPVTDLLTANYRYWNRDDQATYATNEATHFRNLFVQFNLIESIGPTLQSVAGPAGVMTLNPWGQNFFQAGTNRRNWPGILTNFFCCKQDAIRSLAIPDLRVRRDVPRIQSGSFSSYSTECRGCHATMDALAGAFAQYDWTTQRKMEYLPVLRDKLNTPQNYPSGFVVDSEDWVLMLEENHFSNILGIRETGSMKVQRWGSTSVLSISGSGLQEFAEVLANAMGFYRCMVKRVVMQIFKNKPFSVATATDEELKDLDSDEVEAWAGKLSEHKSLRTTIKEVAIASVVRAFQ